MFAFASARGPLVELGNSTRPREVNHSRGHCVFVDQAQMQPTVIEAFDEEGRCVMRWHRAGAGFVCSVPVRRRPWRVRSVAEIIKVAPVYGACEVSCIHQRLKAKSF